MMYKGFENWVEIEPAWDKTDKGCVVHGVNLRFLLKGKHGVIQFLIYTNWMLPHNQKEIDGQELLDEPCRYLFHKPLPADIGYHSYIPTYKNQEPLTDNCKYLDSKPCYYDGSGLQAEKLFDIMVKGGHEAMWDYMIEHYNRTFKQGD